MGPQSPFLIIRAPIVVMLKAAVKGPAKEACHPNKGRSVMQPICSWHLPWYLDITRCEADVYAPELCGSQVPRIYIINRRRLDPSSKCPKLLN